MAILFIVIIFALLLGSAVLYAMNVHWWRVSFIAGIMFGAVALLWIPGDGDPKKEGFDGYGPADRLKPGIDLAGGTRLVYDVVVPAGQPKSKVIEDTIKILSDRVDPSATRGLIWREIAGQRIEVTMALAPAKVREARVAYEAARDALVLSNLTPGSLDKALQSTDAEALSRLASGNADLAAELAALKEAYDNRDQAKQRYEAADKAWNAIPESEQGKHNDVYQKFTLAEDFYFDAKDKYERLERGLLSANSFSPAEFEFLRAIPPKKLSKDQIAAGEKTPREQRLEKLKADYPNLANKIQAAYDALIEYEAVKGPLDGADDLIALLKGSGVLEFRIAADPANLDTLTEYLTQLDEQGPRASPDKPYRWFEVDDLEQYVDDLDERTMVEGWLTDSLSVDSATLEAARQATLAHFGRTAGRTHGVIARPYAGRLYLLMHNSPGLAMTRNDDWSVSDVQRHQGELGRPVVSFSLDGKGAVLMRTMTGPNVDRPMAVLIDDKVLTTPGIRQQLSNGIEISGDFSEADVTYLRDTMRAGALEGQLSEEPVSQITVNATLGADNVRAGLEAAIISLIIVAVFMALYYFYAGLVADFALVANMVLILGILAMTQATFTLPGIAGLVLTIGMAVDANVLIFERIREELVDRKVSLEIATRLGFEKALSTILDANITTLITCLILGYTATSDVKGFAVVLGIGILATMFTALFCTRVLIDLYSRYRKPRTLEMLPTVVPAIHRLFSPNVDWIAKAKFFVPFSAILLVAGFLEAYSRGEDLLDIEFRSGSSVGFTLKPTDALDDNGEPVLMTMNIGEARERIIKVADVAAAVQAAKLAGTNYQAKTAEEGDIVEAVESAYKRHDAAMAEYEKIRQSGVIEKPEDVPNFALLRDVQVVTTGQSESPEVASGFSVATLITDSRAVTDLMKIAFGDVLQTTRPVDFKGSELSAEGAKGIVEPMKTGNLSDTFESLSGDAAKQTLQDFTGGVAIYLNELSPPLSTEQITERIDRMNRQPPYDEMGPRVFKVIGVQRGQGFDDSGKELYNSVVVVAHDNGQTDYTSDSGKASFGNVGGLADTQWKLVRDALKRDTSFSNVTVFNSQVSGTMQQQAVVAILLSLLAVIVYIWVRFGSIRYGLAAIVALVHDVSVALGLVALAGLAYNKLGAESPIVTFLQLEPFKINLAMIAAFLTIIGYSLNDTIVVFDRIRENRGRLSRATPQIINDSINQTISRTVLTSGTTIIAVVTLYVIGGPGVHGFAFAMLLGIFVGTYSSIAIASPILLYGYKDKGPTSGTPESRPAKSSNDEPDIVSEPAGV